MLLAAASIVYLQQNKETLQPLESLVVLPSRMVTQHAKQVTIEHLICTSSPKTDFPKNCNSKKVTWARDKICNMG